jgi:hypothetical protein
MRTWALWILAACAEQQATVAPHDIAEQSGSRLKIEWWELAGGGMQVRGVYDTQLGSECSFERQPDGTFACNDVRVTFDRQMAATRVVPTSLCTDEGLVLPIGFWDTERDVECVPAPTSSRQWRCAPVGVDPTADDPVIALANDTSATGRLQPQLLVADDGLRQHVGSFYDTTLGIRCSVRAASTDSTAFCMPFDQLRLPLDALVAAIPTIDN